VLRELQERNKLGTKGHVNFRNEEDEVKLTVGINGFGRLGRLLCRALCQLPSIQVVAINDPFSDPEYMACMYTMDARADNDNGPNLECTNGVLLLDGRPLSVSSARDPSKIPWGASGTDYVVEASGLFTTVRAASAHLRGPVKKVIIAAPSKDARTVLMGVNQGSYTGEAVVSNGPRAAHSMAVLAATINRAFGIEEGMVTLLHAGKGERRGYAHPPHGPRLASRVDDSRPCPL
jgi:glyceraldehyde 3-phosphate dehydrogenase